MKTLIIRHKKENLKKCSLRHLERDSSLIFKSYPTDQISFEGYLHLKVDAPTLSFADCNYRLLLIDATWRLAAKMEQVLSLPTHGRSLPRSLQTAYPRRQDQENGLASVEALYVAHLILGRPYEHLLNYYYWKEPFLAKNHAVLVDLIHAKTTCKFSE